MPDEIIRLKKIKVNNTTCSEILESLPQLIKKRKSTHIITLNSNMFYEAQRNKDLLELVNTAEVVTPDGVGILWAGKLFGHTFKERVTGYDLFRSFLHYANEHKSSVFFLGGRSKMMDALCMRVKQTYKNLRIVGRHHGFYDEFRELQIVEAIRKTKPDFLFVGMGAFKQEIFIYNYRDQIKVPIMMGVGGSFDVVAGFQVLAPESIRKMGMEWLFRAVVDPKRMPALFKLPLFMIELIWYRIFKAKVV